VIAHDGSLSDELRRRAAASRASGSIEFTGRVDAGRLRQLMVDAEVFVSVPSSDGTSVALLQAMAAGCFPIVADLPTQREWIDDDANGLGNGIRVPVGQPAALAAAIQRALADAELRRSAAETNAGRVRERGLNDTQMARMEELYRGLAGGPKRR
jgi:glycosyltransferase involved in cell wall biosynthesis